MEGCACACVTILPSTPTHISFLPFLTVVGMEPGPQAGQALYCGTAFPRYIPGHFLSKLQGFFNTETLQTDVNTSPHTGCYCQAWNRKHSEGTLCAVDQRPTRSPIKMYSLSSKKLEKDGIVFKEKFVSATKDAVVIEQVIWCTYPCLHMQGL